MFLQIHMTHKTNDSKKSSLQTIWSEVTEVGQVCENHSSSSMWVNISYIAQKDRKSGSSISTRGTMCSLMSKNREALDFSLTVTSSLLNMFSTVNGTAWQHYRFWHPELHCMSDKVKHIPPQSNQNQINCCQGAFTNRHLPHTQRGIM